MNNLRSQLSLENIATNATSLTVGGVPVIAIGCIAIAAVLVGSMYTQDLVEPQEDILPQQNDEVMSGGKKSKKRSKTRRNKHKPKSSKRVSYSHNL